jgi:hypothetical protein
VDRAGSLEPDQVAKVILKSASPQAITNLRRLMLNKGGALGRRAYQNAVASHVEEVFQASKVVNSKTGIDYFNATKARASLGLDKPGSDAFNTTRQMLRGTNISIRELDGFLKTVERAFAEGVPDASTMMVRRAGLSGWKAIMGGFVVGGGGAAAGGPAGAATGIASLVAMTALTKFAGNQVADLLSSPQALHVLSEALKPGVTTAQELRLMRKLYIMKPLWFAALGPESPEAANVPRSFDPRQLDPRQFYNDPQFEMQ